MCSSVVSKRYLNCRDEANIGRAHNLLLQKLREGPLETGQPFGAYRTPKGCARFLVLDAGPVGFMPQRRWRVPSPEIRGHQGDT